MVCNDVKSKLNVGAGEVRHGNIFQYIPCSVQTFLKKKMFIFFELEHFQLPSIGLFWSQNSLMSTEQNHPQEKGISQKNSFLCK